MDLRKALKQTGAIEVNLAPFVGVLFLAATFFAMISAFSHAGVMNIVLPKTVTSDAAGKDNITIVVTSENIMYVDGEVATLQELKRLLAAKEGRGRQVFIKADRRATVGRVVDIWNLGRAMGVEHIDIASEQDN